MKAIVGHDGRRGWAAVAAAPGRVGRPSRLGWIAVVLCGSCHDYRVDEAHRPPPPPAAATAAENVPAPSALPEYVVAQSELRKHRELLPSPTEHDGGVLLDGLRLSADGRSTASEIAEPRLENAARVPASVGGGFLFWSSRALYRASTFLGRLEPVAALAGSIDHVSFGPDFALVVLHGGDRFALSMPAGKPIPLPTIGLTDVAALGDGRAVTLLDPGRVLLTPAKGRPPSDVTARIGAVAELLPSGGGPSGGELWLRAASGTAFKVERDGTLVEFDRLPESVKPTRKPASDDPRWPLKDESPLERAVRRGVRLDDRTALVEVAGAMARVDLATGELKAISARALPAEAQCELVPVEGDVVAVCKGQNVSFVTRGLRDGAAPSIDVSFTTVGTFYAGGDGSLAFGGPCGGEPAEEPSVCVRTAEGAWKHVLLRLGAGGPDAGAPDAGARHQPLRVSRWIPRPDGTAVAIVTGDKPGLYDSARGTLEPFAHTERSAGQAELLQPPASNRLLIDSATAAEGGIIRAYLAHESVTLLPDGSVVRSAWVLSPLITSGPLGVGRSNDGRLWQSLDYGRTWVEVAAPPGTEGSRSGGPEHCSRVGCDFGRWYRLGFPATVPRESERPQAAPAPRLPDRPRPELVCQPSEPARPHVALRITDREGNPREELGFGASTVTPPRDRQLIAVSGLYSRIESSALRALTFVDPAVLDTGSPDAAQAFSRPNAIRFYDPLSPRSAPVDSRYSWRDILSVAGRTGQADVGLLSGNDSAAAVPVLGARGASLDGTLLLDPNGNLVLWARGGAPVRPLVLGPENEGYEPVAATVRGKDELALLLTGESCTSRVSTLNAAGSGVLFELGTRPAHVPCPSNPDALAVAPDGSPAVLRMPSGPQPPTADDPALLLRPGQPALPLAPWSTLRPGDAAECAGADVGYRALVMLPAAWIRLVAPAIASPEHTQDAMVALVRWGTARVCLDVVEIAAANVTVPENELPTAVAARFVAPVEAARRGYALGSELNQPLTCRLGGP